MGSLWKLVNGDGSIRYRLGTLEFAMRVDKNIPKVVCYIGYRRRDGTVKIGGTAFFAECSGPESLVGLVVTGKHVIQEIKAEAPGEPVTLWMNHVDDGMKPVDTDPDRWLFHPSVSSVDAAVYKDPFPLDGWDHHVILKEGFVSDAFLQQFHVGVGDDLYFPGLFIWHMGRTRLSPIVRQGTIAGMPEDPIYSDWLGPMEAFLAEVRSIGGLSGSPVFIHKSPWRYPPELSEDDEASAAYFKYSSNTENPNPEAFVGLVHGHFDEKGKLVDTLTARAVNTGISVIVPAKQVYEVVYQDKILKNIAELEGSMAKKNAATPDATTADFAVSGVEDDLTKADFDDALLRATRLIPDESAPEG